jgi:hypothetical protein
VAADRVFADDEPERRIPRGSAHNPTAGGLSRLTRTAGLCGSSWRPGSLSPAPTRSRRSGQGGLRSAGNAAADWRCRARAGPGSTGRLQ